MSAKFISLNSLQPGQRGRVESLDAHCTGVQRRRLLDLGFVPGTEVVFDLQAPFGGPKAFFVKGAIIALRNEQAQYIRLSEVS